MVGLTNAQQSRVWLRRALAFGIVGAAVGATAMFAYQGYEARSRDAKWRERAGQPNVEAQAADLELLTARTAFEQATRERQCLDTAFQQYSLRPDVSGTL